MMTRIAGTGRYRIDGAIRPSIASYLLNGLCGILQASS